MNKQRNFGAGQTCHKMIAEVAQGMAYELYDALMQRNDWYADWKQQHPGMSGKGLERTFVSKNWGALVPQARTTLAGLLAQPINEDLKAQIHSALLLDSSLPKGKALSDARR